MSGHKSWEELKESLMNPQYTAWDHVQIFFYQKIQNPYREMKFAVSNWIQRVFRGYSRYDVWNYSVNHSRMAVKLLTEYKKVQHGCPLFTYIEETNEWIIHEEQWDAILDDIIYFHTVHAGGERPKELCYFDEKYQHEVSWYDKLTLLPDEKIRYRRGKYYYWKYYEALWD